MTTTEAVVPARSLMLSGTFSMRTITGMRCASRIHSKVGLTEGNSSKPVLPFCWAMPQPMLSTLALQGSVGITHQRDNGPIAVLEIPHEGFPEECLDVEAIGINHGQHRLMGNRGIPDAQS